jgi:cholest-5-ene-3beta,7alpha-diol 3beta-dehydrogenase
MSTSFKILLTGASGTIGREVLRRLVETPNYEVFVFDRKTLETVFFYRPYRSRIHLIYGDLSRKEDVLSLHEKFDVVIHLAAILPPVADRHPRLAEQINVVATNILINHLQSTSPDTFFLYSSCISVYGDRLRNPYITVQDPVSPCKNDVYSQSKADAESIVESSVLRWSIFRVTAILKRHKISSLMFHMPLDTQIETCSPGNAAQAFVNAINHQDQMVGKKYNVGGGERCRITYRDFLNAVFKMAGLGTPTFPPRAFAAQNYHCGYYADSDVLDAILHFRSDDLSACLEEIQSRFTPMNRFVLHFLKHTVKANLLRQSAPYWAYITANKRLVEYYFGEDM